VRSTDFQGKAVVALSKLPEAEATFLFPLDTKAKWEWYLNKPPKDVDEYHFEIFVEGDTAYNVKAYLLKDEAYIAKRGTFRALLANLQTGVQTRPPGKDWGEIDPNFVEIILEELPEGLQIKLKGSVVQSIFGQRPKSVTFTALTPKDKAESEDLVEVVYPD
jgi:hypothetical protein